MLIFPLYSFSHILILEENSMKISNLWRSSSCIIRPAQSSNKNITRRSPYLSSVNQALCSTTSNTARVAQKSNDSVLLQSVNRPRRFYKTVDVVSFNDKTDGKLLYEIKLDDRSLKTQAGAVLQVCLFL